MVGTSIKKGIAEASDQPLSNVRLFRALPKEIIDKLAAVAVRKTCRKGERIFSQGDEGDSLYCVVSGRVRIEAVGSAGQEVFLNELNAGDCFGEIAVVDGLPRTAGATATEPTALLAIHRREVLRLLLAEPQLAMHLLALLCERMRWSTDLYEDSAFLPSSVRLAKRILDLVIHDGYETDGGIEVSVKQTELAAFLGTSRKCVNKRLHKWKERGWVAIARGRLSIRDLAALRELAAGRCGKEEITRQ